jgi:hypothetical protein
LIATSIEEEEEEEERVGMHAEENRRTRIARRRGIAVIVVEGRRLDVEEVVEMDVPAS